MIGLKRYLKAFRHSFIILAVIWTCLSAALPALAGVNTTKTSIHLNQTSVHNGSPVQLTSTVTDSSGSSMPTGTVTFADGGTPIADVPLEATVPVVETAGGGPPSVPSGDFAGCYAGPNSFTLVNCPVLKWGDYTYWAIGYKSNIFTFDIVAFDQNGNIVKQFPLDGARYLYKITLDTTAHTVTFWGQNDSTATLNWSQLPVAQTVSYSYSPSTSGVHTITASYSGDVNHVSSSPVTATLTSTSAITTTDVSSSKPVSVYGDDVDFTATVTGGVYATGTVTFKDGTTALGTGTLQSNGQAVVSVSGLSAGIHSITAEYSGDSNNSGNTSPPLTQSVVPNAASLWTTVGPSSPGHVVTLYNMGETLYAGTHNGSNDVWMYNKGTWTQMSGSPGDVNTLLSAGGTLYAGTGWFGIGSIWTYSGGKWMPMSDAPDKMHSLTAVGDTLYAGTYNGSNDVWSYNNGKWTQMSGSPGKVSTVLNAGGTLYAETLDPSHWVWSLWSCNYGKWTKMSGSPGYVSSLVEAGDTLYAGPYHGGNDVWSYNNGKWTKMSDSPGNIYSLVEMGGTLYAGTMSGSNDVWSYEKGKWSPSIGSPANIYSLITANSKLYATDTAKVYQVLVSPDAPANLYSGNMTSSSTALTWDAVPGATGYHIYENGGDTAIATVTDAVYSMNGLTSNTPYTFTVSAFNAVGESAKSGAVNVLTAPNVPEIRTITAGDGQVALTWNPVQGTGTVTYSVYKGTASGSYGAIPVALADGSTDNYTATGLTNGTTYYFAVTASNAEGSSEYSTEAGAMPQVPAPGAPAGLTASAGDGQVALTWRPVPGTVSYSVYEGMASGSYEAAPIATVTGLTYDYTATGLTNGTMYYFAVTANNAGGSSGCSNEASATPEPNLSVTYDGNGAAFGTVPIDSSTYTPGASVSISGNTGRLAKKGSKFAGWNTQADGNGTNYQAGDTLIMGTTNVTLYAQWINLYTVSFNSNGGTEVGSQTVDDSGTATRPADPARSGYTFDDWYSDSSLTTPFHFETPITADTSLYAKWTANHDGGNDNEPSPPSASGTSSPTSSDIITSTNGTLTLPVGLSGKVNLGDEVRIAIPADAFNQNLRLTITKVAGVQRLITHNEVLASPVFEILKNFPENFRKKITLTFAFDPKNLKGNLKPSVFYYDETRKTWVEVGGEVDGSTIIVKVNHFTKYAVFAVDQPSGSKADAKPSIHFSDISGHWAEANIKRAVADGIVSGYPDGTFKPDHAVTRAEFTVMLMHALKPQDDGAALTFTDTGKIGTWAQISIAQAVHAGIISGYKDGSFRPDAEITRSEMAVMIIRALGRSGSAAGSTGFADDKDIPAWARNAVAALKNLGIIEGDGANQFAPGDETTRAEAVTVLLKMLTQMS